MQLDLTGEPLPRHAEVCNQAATTAMTLHIYGTDVSRVGSSVRRYYD